MIKLPFPVLLLTIPFLLLASCATPKPGQVAKVSPVNAGLPENFTIRDLWDRVDEAYHIPDRYQRYARFLELYQAAPIEYWYQKGGMSHYLRLLTDALVFYGRTEEAIPLLMESFSSAGSGRQYVFQRFLGRFESTYPISRRIQESRNFQKALTRTEQELSEASPEDDAALFTARELFYYYLNRVYPLLKGGDDREALILIDKAERLARDFSLYPWELQFTDLFRRALLFYRDHQPGKLSEADDSQLIRFRWLGLFTPQVDALIQERDGTVRECQVQMEDQQIAERILYNQGQVDTAAWLFYYLSGGAIWMEFEFRRIDSVLTGEIPADLIPEKLDPFPFDTMGDLYENYDGLIYLYPNELRPGVWTGGNTWPPLVPRILRSNRRFFTIWMRESGSWRTYIHEIFHNFEQVYKIKPSHGFLEEKRESWPQDYAAWVSREGVPSELVYYEDRFSRIVVPQGLEPVLDREKKTIFTREGWEKARESYLSLPRERIEKAWELHRAAIEESRSEDPAGAELLWNRSLEQFDGIVEVYSWYANYLEKAGRREEALAIRKQAVERCTGLPGMDGHYQNVLPALLKAKDTETLRRYLQQMERLLPPEEYRRWEARYGN